MVMSDVNDVPLMGDVDVCAINVCVDTCVVDIRH